MLRAALTVARKEIVDHGRDTRALASTALYTLMGPAIVLLVSTTRHAGADGPADPRVLVVMASVFVLLSAFSGGMSVAMDTMSGERERRSLLPLLLDGVPSWSIVLGKWLAASLFAAASLGLAFAAFTVVLTVASEAVRRPDWSVMWFAPPILALVLGAVSLELLVSTACRTTKEAHTWLSILLFVVMALAMWLAFRPAVAGGVSLALPIAGQQRLLQQFFEGLSPAPATAAALTAATGCLALPFLAGSRWLLQHESAFDG